MPIFGYLIFIEADQFNRLWPTPIIEIISQEGLQFYASQTSQKQYFAATGNYTSVFGEEFNFWLPIYINEEHFLQSKEEVLNVILKIYNLAYPDQSQKFFEPKMVLKVLPPILVKTVIRILKGDLHQSYAALDAYCQFYWLFMKLINIFPELQECIEQEVEKFIHDEDFRHKRRVGDLGEFKFKLSLSKYGIYNNEINKALVAEFLTRQVSWVKGKNAELKKSCNVVNLVKKFMSSADVATQFFIIGFETAKLMVNDLVRAKLEESYGVLDPLVLDNFMKKVKWIRRNVVDDWKVLVKAIGLEEAISSEEQFKEMIATAFDKEEEKYSRWGQIRCSVTDVEFKDSRQPIFGYMVHTYPSFVLNPNIICNFATHSQWLPLYINSEHFERAKSIFNKNISTIYHSMVIHNKPEKATLSQIVIKVFCHTLALCVEKISVERRVQFPVIKAYIQTLWTFWKIIEKNEAIRQLLEEEITLVLEKGQLRNLSWTELREFMVKLILCKKSNDNLNIWSLLLEEFIWRSAKSAVGNIRGYDKEGFDCHKFGKFDQDQIKLSLVQIILLKTVLQDGLKVQLEQRLGFLRGYEVLNIKSELIEVYKQRYFDLWKIAINVLDLNDIIKGSFDMSQLTREKFKEAAYFDRMERKETRKIEEAQVKFNSYTTPTPNSITPTLAGLGLKFVVHVKKSKKN